MNELDIANKGADWPRLKAPGARFRIPWESRNGFTTSASVSPSDGTAKSRDRLHQSDRRRLALEERGLGTSEALESARTRVRQSFESAAALARWRTPGRKKSHPSVKRFDRGPAFCWRRPEQEKHGPAEFPGAALVGASSPPRPACSDSDVDGDGSRDTKKWGL
jgi:hypothetical protein